MDGHRFRMNFATVLRFTLEANGSLVAKVRIKPDAESTSAAISDEWPGISADTLKGCEAYWSRHDGNARTDQKLARG